jgi:arylsulfatase A-like enzyme
VHDPQVPGLRLLAGLALWLAGCAGPSGPPDVVLVTLDTLRADRLGAYGATDVSTPAFDALAAEGVLFEHAAAPMPLTVPSHASMLTGKYPREHGVLNHGMALPDGEVTVAETLRDRGYRTAAFVAVSLLAPEVGLGQGFETFSGPPGIRRRAERVVPEALAWVEGVPADQPLLLWVHLFDPHLPYAPGPPWETAAIQRTGGRWPRLNWTQLERLATANGGDLPREVLDQALRLYAGEVEYTDRWLGRLIEGLQRRGRWRSTAVAVAADHGECFENGIYFEHADCLFEGAIRVPLVVLYPGRAGAGRRVAEQVSLVDLAPTLLAAAGVPAVAGQSGVAHPPDAGGDARRAVLIQHPVYRSRTAVRRQRRQQIIRSVAGDPTRPVLAEGVQVGVATPEWKYLRTEGRETLYRLGDRPDEATDRAAEEPDVRSAMRRRLAAELTAHPASAAARDALDDELRKTLEALGYL